MRIRLFAIWRGGTSAKRRSPFPAEPGPPLAGLELWWRADEGLFQDVAGKNAAAPGDDVNRWVDKIAGLALVTNGGADTPGMTYQDDLGPSGTSLGVHVHTDDPNAFLTWNVAQSKLIPSFDAPFTFFCVFREDDVTTDQRGVFLFSDDDPRYQLGARSNGASVLGSVNNDSGGTVDLITPSGKQSDGSQIAIVVVNEGDDGAIVATYSTTSTATSFGTGKLAREASGNLYPAIFNAPAFANENLEDGVVFEAGLYSVALDEGQTTELFDYLVGRYKFTV